MILLKRLTYILLVTFIIQSCSSGSEDIDDGSGNSVEQTPTLIFPLNDSECFQGTIISDTRSDVLFEWNGTASASSYILTLTNLNTNKESGITSTETSKKVTLERGVPYSWYVIAIGERFSDQTKSSEWKFYNAGLGTQNYAPFPAEATYPIMGSTAPTNFNLTWNSSDLDGDNLSYEIFMDTNASPTTSIASVTVNEYWISSLSSDTIYYWKIITKDSYGNESTSPIFDFRTQ
ncbi:hypothetical protein [Flavicella sp.]|uniref:hypothetical protein n=1 Tax=Flavicella sp. TaxID=2957742 RepID=UPI0026102A19|nr:hypothetical protein [Flavicella sp.]MDG1805497.1 hypothetical protein [Flavicella sp.]